MLQSAHRPSPMALFVSDLSEHKNILNKSLCSTTKILINGTSYKVVNKLTDNQFLGLERLLISERIRREDRYFPLEFEYSLNNYFLQIKLLTSKFSDRLSIVKQLISEAKSDGIYYDITTHHNKKTCEIDGYTFEFIFGSLSVEFIDY